MVKPAIKDGRSAVEIWPDQPAKAAQKDVDARWTVKHSRAKPVTEGEKAKPDIAVPVFRYKNHIGIDRRYGLIRTWLVSDAAAHDGARLREGLVDSNASDVWADTACERRERTLSEGHRQGLSHPCRSPRANRCLGAPQGERSEISGEIQVEHVFAEQKARMKLVVRTIGIAVPGPRSALQASPTT